MSGGQIALYIIWFLIPAFFLFMALYAKLEQFGNSPRKQNPLDFLKQGLFVLLCIGIAVLIDQYVLESFVNSFSPDFIPLGFYRVILLPLLLYIGARLIGPTKDISITKAPNPTSRGRKR
jgi:hypothetical protein